MASRGSSAAFWVSVALVLGGLVWLLRDVLAPFVAGVALAYLLDPLVQRVSRFVPRPLSAAALCVGFFLAIGVAVGFVVPWAVEEVGDLIAALPAFLDALARHLEGWGWAMDAEALRATFRDALGSENGRAFAIKTFATLWRGGGAVVGFASFLVITPVVATYLLIVWRPMLARLDALIPPQRAPVVRSLAGKIDDTLAGFVRGQLLVCFVLGSFYAVVLALLGLPFAVLIGFAAGAISFIPFVGALLGGAVAMAVALWAFAPDWLLIAATFAVFAIGQVLEGWVLTPWLVGKRVGLHPVWLLFALAAFGSLFGFTGLLLATPMAATLGVLTRFLLGVYEKSRFYAPPSSESDTGESGTGS